MLRSRLVGSITSPGISSILAIDDSNRLLVAKKNGDIEVYSNDQDKTSSISQFKLFQTYSNLLRNVPNASNLDLNIIDLLYSQELNTIFIKCKCLLILLNSTNLHLYDKIYDKRGINQVWVKTYHPTSSHIDPGNVENLMTLLAYTTSRSNKLRILIWMGRIYQQMLEITLPKQSTDPIIKSLQIVANGQSLLFTMSSGVYIWNFKSMGLHQLNSSKSFSSHSSTISSSSSSSPSSSSPYVVKIDKIYTKKYPDNVIDAITSLKEYTTNGKISTSATTTDHSSITNNDQSKKSKSRFWKSREKSSPNFTNDKSREIRYIFKTHSNDTMILDGMTQNLFIVDIDDTQKSNKLIALEKRQFFQWNNEFNHLHYMSSDLLLLYNDHKLKFVDYNNGFTFLQEYIDQGIKKIINLPGIYYLVWTHNDQLLLYTYQVDDDEDDRYEPITTANSTNTSRSNLTDMADSQSANSEFSICGMYHDSSFYQLWRKVLFYQFFLESPYALQLCASDDPEQSLDICAMKLRDLTVMWCLQMFATFQSCMDKIIYLDNNSNNNPNKNKKKDNSIISYLNKVEEVVIRDIFNFFITMRAPPQLIIVKTFPKEISYLVELISQQEHKCHDDGSADDLTNHYKINPNLIQKWVLPYLTDMRRQLRNLLVQQEKSESNGTITWNYENRHISQDLDFFLLDKHGSIQIETMLTLIETVLFKTYILYVPSMVGPLIRVENLCDKSVVINDLKKKNMFNDLIDFYFQKQMHHDALEFLFNDITDEKTLTDNNQTILIVNYLKRLPNENLKDLFYYLTKLIDNSIDDTKIKNEILISIFESTDPVNLKRDNLKVYEYIDKIDKSLSLEYLEFIIHTIIDVDPEMFTNLVSRYISQLTDVNMDRLEDLLKTNSHYNPNEILHILEDCLLNGTIPNEHRQFIELLQIYPLYRLNEHERSIDILFSNLNDYERASNYCFDVYSDDNKIGSDILLYLLNLLIKKAYPGNGQSTDTDQLFTFLHDYRDKLNIIEVLKALPTNFPIRHIKNFLMYSIRNEKMNDETLSLTKNVLQVELTNVKYSINQKNSSFVEVNSNNTCKVCNKSFHSLSTESVYWFTMPNGKQIVVHYNCGKSLQNKLQNNKQRDSAVNHPMSLSDLKKYIYSDK